MQELFKNLMSESKNACLPEEFNFFGKLIGGWEIDYINNSNSCLMKGTWHFSWILDGMAIQDVINLPDYELGTTLRIYNPVTNAWDIAYCYMGRIMRFEAIKQGDKIVLTNIEDERRKWLFVKIEDNNFHWQDIRVQDDGKWQVDFDLYAHRIN